MAFRLSRLCAARRRTSNRQLAEYMKLDYARHMPDKYVQKVKNMVPHQVYEERFGLPTHYRYFGNRKYSEEDYVRTPYRPWERQAIDENFQADMLRARKGPAYRAESATYPAVTPLPDEEWVYFVGDKVQVLVGADAGKTGFVTYVSRDTNQIIVGGLHVKRREIDDFALYGVRSHVVVEEQFLDVANDEVMLVDPNSGLPAKVRWEYAEVGNDKKGAPIYDVVRVTEFGSRVPMPEAAYATYEYVTRAEYVETDKDTKAQDALDETYEPELDTFEGSLEKQYGLEPARVRNNTYWY